MGVSKMPQSKLEKILAKQHLTEEEAISILKSSRGKPSKKEILDISKNHTKYGYFSDPHIGHNQFKEPVFYQAVKVFNDEKVDFVLIPGDHLEGMSHRPGHIYELTHLGFHQQIKYASDLYNEIKQPILGIDGNHDAWYFKPQNMGVIVGEELERRVKNYKHLGQDEGDIQLAPNITIKLFHANDGTAYADSYKLQKLIESFSGGEKPNILHSGHYHKHMYMFRRNIHGFESGTLCGQSKFMRGKKIPAHIGFGIVDAYYGKNGIDRLDNKFFPYYER